MTKTIKNPQRGEKRGRKLEMRTMKKLMVLVLSVMMVLGTSVVSAFAADSIKITLKSPDPGTETGESLTAYKVLDVTKKDGVNAHNDNSAALGFSYYIAKNSAWIQAVRAVTQFDLTETADNTGYNVKLDDGITPSESVAKEIAATLLANKPPAASGITVASGETVDAEAGYYLIESPLGSNLILATTNIEITEQNNYPTVDKAVAAKDEVAEIGSIVTFTLTVDVPTTATQKITLTDTMSEGLTFVAIDSVKQGNTDVDHDDTDADPQHQTFMIEFSADTVKANQGKTIVVTYRALVNENAKVSAVNTSETDDNTNAVELKYSNYKQTDTVDVNTLSFELNKYDGSDADKTPIAGAKFQLLNASKQPIKLVEVKAGEEYRLAVPGETGVTEFTTVAGKKVTFKGVDSDLTYYLHETEAPKGYNKLAADVEVKPATDLSTVAEVPNNVGTELPSTGGMGTTILYIVGGLLVVGCGIMLVAKKKADK